MHKGLAVVSGKLFYICCDGNLMGNIFPYRYCNLVPEFVIWQTCAATLTSFGPRGDHWAPWARRKGALGSRLRFFYFAWFSGPDFGSCSGFGLRRKFFVLVSRCLFLSFFVLKLGLGLE